MYTALIAAVLTAFIQYGPALVKSVTELITGNPQQQGETDDAYIARINAMIEQKAAETAAIDAQIQQE